MRIATWNVNSLKARLERVEEWLGYAQPDVLCMQETKFAEAAFPYMALQGMGYEVAHHGGGRWNGVAILSRVGLSDVVAGFTDDVEDEEIESRAIWATCNGVRICSVYVPNGRALDDPHYQYKLHWLDRLNGMLQRDHKPDEALIVCGDFNIAATDLDVYNAKKFVGATHVSEAEREKLQSLEDWGLVDLFRLKYPDERVFSWWDYRSGDFHKGNGMRLDLILGTQTIADKLSFISIDRQARKGTSPSDHAPVFADIDV